VVPWHYIADGHVAHGYATTIHKAQGATYDRTLLLGDDRLYRQAGYTGLSRGRERNDMYLVVDDDREHDVELARHGQAPPDEPVERLVKALHRDGAKLLAFDARRSDAPRARMSLTLSELWAVRDSLAAELDDGMPAAGSARSSLTEATEIARTRVAEARAAREATEELAAASRSRLRRRAPRSIERDLARAIEFEERAIGRYKELEDQLALPTIDDTPDQDLRLSELDADIDERARLAGRAAEIDRPHYIVDLIGEPPTSLVGRDEWRAAAAAIESYRARWDALAIDAVDSQLASVEHVHHLARVQDHIDRCVEPASEHAIGLA
jgi:hypothetical protein